MTSRRQALGVVGVAAAGMAALPAEAQAPAKKSAAAAPAAGRTSEGILRTPVPPPVVVPRTELVNVLEYEPQARLVAGAAKMAVVTGSDRSITDRITLRPRMNIPTQDLDLTSTILGDAHFTPIIVGPLADQRRFHAEGELATARGVSAAKAAMVLSSESSVPLAQVAQAMTTPLYVQVYAGSPKVKDTLAAAGAARAKAVFVTVNAGPAGAGAGGKIDWAAVDTVVKGTSLPVVVKGVTTPAEAKEAVARGARAVVVSNWHGGNAAALPGTLLMVAPVVQAVGAQVPVFVDSSFRRGTDIVKALGLGAKAVLVARPVMWGLAAYGADGVQGVVEMLQTETARYMCMCGRPNLAAVNPSLVRVHGVLPAVRNNG
jgi:4-hydroxymandelate oxidase